MKKELKKKVLIVGGTGFLGHHICKFLVKRKFNVISISRNRPRKFRKVKDVYYLFFDISQKKNFNFFKKKICDVNYVINLSGEVDHLKKKEVFLSHFKGVKNLSMFFLKKNLIKFIQIGSSMEYGKLKSPHVETKLCKPISNYGLAKLKSSDFLLSLYRKYFFPVVILRPYQVYGPNQSPNRIISFAIENCLKEKKFPCSQGIQKRDFLYISDFLNGVYNCLKKNYHINGNIINIGYGKAYSIKKIIKKIKLMIKTGEPEFGKIELRKEEILETYPDISKIKKLINWEPKIDLNRGLAKTIKFFKKKL